MSAVIKFPISNKLIKLWEDKLSIRNRNEFILELTPAIARRSRLLYGRYCNEQKYTNECDAFSDTILFAFREWHEYTDLQTFLVHVFGYLKYYRFRHKFYEQHYLSFDCVAIERIIGLYAIKLQYQNIGVTQLQNVDSILNNIPKLERDILEMFLIDGWSKKEIGDRLNITEQAVDKHYKKALKLCRLKKAINTAETLIF